MVSETDKKFIRMAIEEAVMARKNGDRPFGAVLVKNDQVVASGRNQVFDDYTWEL